ncbi:MAG: hypothetical protein NWE86_00660 [Candidatus Bathyarchaeota archaeon]|nr:hypothetical protein [Candidatus Bathyarchaeota archaeon]
MLIHIPRLYSKDEFVNFCSKIPKDYDAKSEEFWGYVEEKLKPYLTRACIKRIYLESLDKKGDEGIGLAKEILDSRGFKIIKLLIDKGGKLHATEDTNLIQETSSWLALLGDNPNLNIMIEMYQESLSERDSYIAKVIDQTLKDNEIGVIIIEPTHRLSLPEDIKVIKMCRFDPSDYLKSFLYNKI